MRHIFLFALLTFLIVPASALAARLSAQAGGPASFSAARSLIVASSSLGNAYLAGVSVVSAAPVAGDLLAIGGSVVTTGAVQGDELLLGGSVSSRALVTGDVRAIGGRVNIEESVSGDLVALGLSVYDAGRTLGSTFIIAANATLSSGAAGPVTVYGNNIALVGNFAGDVTIVATGRLSLAASTTIRGKLSYEAPEAAAIPDSATILSGIEYTSVSYLPDVGTSRTLALVSIGVFLFARVLGALILAGLLAGLFPKLAEAVASRAYEVRPRSVLFTMMLGFGILVAVPVLIILLALTFVGIGLALLLLIAYALLAFLAFLYAGILLGSVLVRRFLKRETVFWHDGVLGMLALSLISLVPYLGLFTVLLCTIFAAGALLQIFFRFAFPHEEHTSELL